MKKETQKISSELAIGIIITFAIIVAVAVYRAGSFSAVMNYIPQINKKKEMTKKEPEKILFATNGDREIYKVRKDDGKWAVVIDGQEGEAYDDVFNGVFSDDGTQFAYGAQNDGWEFVVLNNKASEKKYSDIGQLIFSHDGVLIYKVIGEDGEFLVIGEEEGQKYTHIGEIVILDDGRIAFQAELNGEQVTVIDGQVVDNNPPVAGGDLIDTPDDDSNDDIPNVTTPPSSTSKTRREKKDWVIPVTEQNYPVCEGVGCNF